MNKIVNEFVPDGRQMTFALSNTLGTTDVIVAVYALFVDVWQSVNNPKVMVTEKEIRVTLSVVMPPAGKVKVVAMGDPAKDGLHAALVDLYEDIKGRQEDGANYNPGTVNCLERIEELMPAKQE